MIRKRVNGHVRTYSSRKMKISIFPYSCSAHVYKPNIIVERIAGCIRRVSRFFRNFFERIAREIFDKFTEGRIGGHPSYGRALTTGRRNYNVDTNSRRTRAGPEYSARRCSRLSRALRRLRSNLRASTLPTAKRARVEHRTLHLHG